MRALVNVNGRITLPPEAKISVFDRGFLFGDAVYETGRTYQACCLYLEEHLERLRCSAGKLQIPVLHSDLDLKRELYATLKEFGEVNAYFRVILSRGELSHVSLDSISDLHPTLVLIVQELPSQFESVRNRGLKVLTSTVLRNSSKAQDPNIKTSNYLNSLLALQDVKSRGAEDAILCDAAGNVAEGTTFAVFGVTDKDELITSSLEVGILDSITRRHVLELAKSIMPIKEGFIPLKEFQSCTEVFVASSIREIIAVSSWDGKPYPIRGPITKKLHEKLRQNIDTYVQTHEKFNDQD